ncbi:nucleotidyltransferase family protein [Affinirhizobium pseudoryzae]|jgi:hypothetical protein|uniref:nucleotidyltransferase family protein n=1 Tax=Allorhizobium pseudoryzae TaxID=379684 RepID=UPI0013E9D9FD|nr:nucleotidyltransferase domain-containing protein [Allorhizobium pseudoryzae]
MTADLHQSVPQVRANYGSFGSEDAVLAEIIRRLVEALDPEMIWLFGSRGRGDARPDSDFDVLVVAKENGSFDSDDYDKVYAPLMGTGVGADVVPCDYATFMASLDLNTSIVRRIVDEGRLIFGSRP